MISRSLILLAALLLPATALALEQPSQYYGFTLGTYTLDDGLDDLDSDLSDNAGIDNVGRLESTDVGFRAGYDFHRFFGIEGRAGYSTGQNGNLRSLHDELYYGGVFGRFKLPFQRLNLYALAGVGGVQLELDDDDADALGVNDKYGDIGASWGVGVELFGSDRVAITLDYMSYANNQYDGFSFGFVHHFDWPRLRR